jgi:hypothetical protein
MKTLRKLIGHELTWSRHYALGAPVCEIRAGQKTVATLRFHGPNSMATAESADGCWTFQKVGFFRTRATVKACEGSQYLAALKNSTWSNGGIIEQVDGQNFLARVNFWNGKFDIASAAGESLIRYESRFGVFQPTRVIVIQSVAGKLNEISWLTLFGCYLLTTVYSAEAVVVAG